MTELEDFEEGEGPGGYACEVCDATVRFRNRKERLRRTGHWVSHNYAFINPESGLAEKKEVLTCPTCAQLGFEAVLQGHGMRIKQGRDPRYH